MPHRTRPERFLQYFENHQIGKRLTRTQTKIAETVGGGIHAVKNSLERFTPTKDCIDFFDPKNKDLWLPEIKDPASYLHGLNESKTIRAAREHALDCRRCATTLDAFLLSQVDPKLFSGALKPILELEVHYDPLKHLFIAGLPWPHHESDRRYGRLVYVTPLPLRNGVIEFQGRVLYPLERRMPNLKTKFSTVQKKDEVRKACYQASSHLDDLGRVTIRSRIKSPEAEDEFR